MQARTGSDLNLIENIELLTHLINSVGIPVAIVVILLIQTYKEREKYRILLLDMQKTVDSNTTVIKELVLTLNDKN